MNQLNKLRNSLRGYYDARQSPYDDREWERASALLRSARRKRKFGYLGLILVAGFTALLVPIAKFQDPSTENKQTPAESVQPKKAVSKNTQVKEIGLTSATEGKRLTGSERKEKTFHSVSAGSPVIVQKKTTEEPSIPNSDNPVRNNEPTNSFTAEGTVGSLEAGKTFTDVANGDQTTIESEPPVEDSNSSSIALEVAEDKKQPVEQSQPDKVEIVQEQTGDLVSKEKVTAGATQIPLTSNSGFTNEIQQPDSVVVAENNIPGEGIFYEAGLAWFYGWNGSDGRDASGLSPVLGINYLNQLNNRFAFSFGVQYLSVPNLSNSSKISRVSSYRYGEFSKVTVITPRTLYYLGVPLRFHYNLNEQNTVGGGVNMAYLLNVNATVETYDEKPGATENFETVTLSGYTDGFSWFDSQVSLFYRRELCSRLGLQAELFFGLTDIKQNQFFNSDAKERNSGAKLTLVYYAFRKNTGK